MKLFNSDEAYRLTDDLLRAIKFGEQTILGAFGVTPAIHEEITEELERSGENVASLTLPPYSIAFKPDGTGRIPFDCYETATETDTNARRIACQLWAEGVKTDLTLIADYTEKQGTPSLAFRLLEVQ